MGKFLVLGHIRKLIAVFTLLMMLLLYKHYLHLTNFPGHPIIDFVRTDWLIHGIYLVLVLITVVLYIKPVKYLSLLYLVLFTIYFFLDLNFLMPFILFYMSIWVCYTLYDLEICSENDSNLLIRLFTIGVYLSSSLQKFNPNFQGIVYPWLIAPFRSVVSVSVFQFLEHLVWFIPIWEGLVTMLLLFRKTRRLGLIMALAIHIVILFLYSPLHLNYFGPLFPFNFSLIFIVYFSFNDYQDNVIVDVIKFGRKLVLIPILVFSIGFPVCYYFGVGHAYLSYDLYSGNYRYTKIYFDRTFYMRLPESYRIRSQFNPELKTYSICLDSWLFYETYGTIYRSENSFDFYKSHFRSFKSKQSHAVFIIYRNGKKEYVLL